MIFSLDIDKVEQFLSFHLISFLLFLILEMLILLFWIFNACVSMCLLSHSSNQRWCGPVAHSIWIGDYCIICGIFLILLCFSFLFWTLLQNHLIIRFICLSQISLLKNVLQIRIRLSILLPIVIRSFWILEIMMNLFLFIKAIF